MRFLQPAYLWLLLLPLALAPLVLARMNRTLRARAAASLALRRASRLSSAAGEVALAAKTVQDRFLSTGAELVPESLQSSAGFGDYIRKEFEATREAANAAGLKPE